GYVPRHSSFAYLMKKFPDISQRIKEDYHSIKDDIPLVSVYTTGNVLVRGMLIPDAFLTEEIRATADFKEYETVTPTLTASPQGKKRKQIAGESSSPRKSQKITIRKKKQSETLIPPLGDDQEREEVAEATILILNDDVDDSGNKIEPESHKENPKNVDDDDEEIHKEKKDEEIEKQKKDDNVEKTDEVVKEKDIVDDVTGSMEIRKEQKQTPIPSPTISLRNISSSDKTVYDESTSTVSPTTTTTSKDSSTTKHKKRVISYKTKTKTLPGSIDGMCRQCNQIWSHIKNKFITRGFFMSKIREVLDHCNKVNPEITFAKTNETIKEEMPRLVNLAVNKDREVDPINPQEMIAKEFATHEPKIIEELFRKHMQNTTFNIYPTTSMSTAGKSSADLQHQLYVNMKSKPQDQAADPKI
ncbi:hypothetical protein Tco_0943937, partial [Tanacetum coccineum]